MQINCLSIKPINNHLAIMQNPISNSMDSKGLTVSLKVNSGKWKKKILQLNFLTNSFDIWCGNTNICDYKIDRNSCISAKVIQNIRNVYLRTCLKNDKDVREYVFFEMEFSSTEDLDEFAIFLKENNFIKPQQKKVLVFVNPVSGRGRAKKIWSEVRAILSETEVEYETVITERAGQALEAVETLNFEEYSGAVTVSGDGGLFEIINGLYRRRHKEGISVMDKLHIGIVPGGSGHGVHCSLLHRFKEKFASEIPFSCLSLARHENYRHDIIECQTKKKDFASVFGVAWGIIPEVDFDSEFLRFMGPSRGWVLAVWKWIFLHHAPGTVHYLPYHPDHDDMQLPGVDDPVPDSWVTVQGPFFNVYACKQNWLDYNLCLVPDAEADDGKLWLVIMDNSWTRYKSAYWMFNADKCVHVGMPGTTIVPISAFRFVPSEPKNAIMSIDAERLDLDGGPVQGVIRRSRVNFMTKEK